MSQLQELPSIKGASFHAPTEHVRDATLRQLWALYTIRGASSVTEWEFCVVQCLTDDMACLPSSESLAISSVRPSRQSRASSLPRSQLSQCQSPAALKGARPLTPGSLRVKSFNAATHLPLVNNEKQQSPSPQKDLVSMEEQVWEACRANASSPTFGEIPSSGARAKACFRGIDQDSDGLINFDDFLSWQTRLWNESRKCPTVKQHQLTALVRNLGGMQNCDERFAAWRKLFKDMQAAASLYNSDDLIGALAAGQTAVQQARGSLPLEQDAMVADVEQQLAGWRESHQEKLCCSLESATTLVALEAAISDVEAAAHVVQLPDDVLQLHNDRLAALQMPFKVHVSTLSGSDFYVDVLRSDAISVLREQVAITLELRPYRIVLVNSDRRLEHDTATLESCGVYPGGNVEVGVSFNAVERWLEMSVTEFLELGVRLGEFSSAQAANIQDSLQKGFLTTRDLHRVHGPSIEQVEKHEAERQQQVQEEAHRQRQLEKEFADAADIIFRRNYEAKKAELGTLSVTSLCEALRGVGMAAPEEISRTALIQILARRAGMDSLEAEARAGREELGELESRRQEGLADLEKDLGEVMPALEDATQKLMRLRPKDVIEIKCMKKPPYPVALALEVLAIMFEIRPTRQVDHDNPGRMRNDYWTAAVQGLLRDPTQMFAKMTQYDKDDIPDKVIRKMTPYMAMEDFQPDHLRRYSHVCEIICLWIRAMYKYYFVSKAVQPRRDMLSEIQADASILTLRCDVFLMQASKKQNCSV